MHSAPETAWSRCHLTRQERTAATRSERHEPARERARFGTALADALARASERTRRVERTVRRKRKRIRERARSLARALASAHPPRWPPLASGHSRNERTLCGILPVKRHRGEPGHTRDPTCKVVIKPAERRTTPPELPERGEAESPCRRVTRHRADGPGAQAAIATRFHAPPLLTRPPTLCDRRRSSSRKTSTRRRTSSSSRKTSAITMSRPRLRSTSMRNGWA